jgi:hypothetical protein
MKSDKHESTRGPRSDEENFARIAELSARIDATERLVNESLARFRERSKAFSADGRSCDEVFASLPVEMREQLKAVARRMRDKARREQARKRQSPQRPAARKLARTLV